MALRALRLLPELNDRYPDFLSLPPVIADAKVRSSRITTCWEAWAPRPVVIFLDDLEWPTAPRVLDYASKRWAEKEPLLLH